MTTKQQERKALEQIKKIVEGLGEYSYIGTAFAGCFDLADQNIEYDAAFNMKELADAGTSATEQLKKEKEKIAALEKQLECEQEWKAYEDTHNVSQSDYTELSNAGGTEILTDEEAKDLLYGWYGFAKEKVTIFHHIDKTEVNRHHLLRTVGKISREPLYNATDWNYIRFDSGCMSYELHNDDLKPYLS